jgi:hypothetical protein
MTNPWADPDVFGVWKEPALIVIFGEAGAGKSFDATLFCPDGYTLSAPGALKGTMQVLGADWYEYAQSLVHPVRTLDEITKFLLEIAAGLRERRPVRIDDMSITAQATLDALGAVYDERNNRKKYEVFKAMVFKMKEAARQAGVHVIASAHVQPPHTNDKGVFTKGGPSMGAPSACAPIYASADVIYKIEVEEGRFPHPAVYRCIYPDNTWAFKDRHNALYGVGPANLRELLLNVGMKVPRPDGLAWMDDQIERIATEITGGADKLEVWERYRSYLTEYGMFSGHVYWTLRDGVDRAAIRMRKSPMDMLLAGNFGAKVGPGVVVPGAVAAPAAPPPPPPPPAKP